MRAASALLLALALAPRPARAALGPIYGGDVAVSVPALPDSLDPASPDDASHRLVLGLVHETLLRLDQEGRLGPGLARPSRDASGLEWRLDLDPEARFHDDAPLTADDAARAIRRFLDGGSAAGLVLRDALLPDGLDTPDARTVVLRFRAPQLEGPRALAAPGAAVTSPGGAGAGPFLATLVVPGRRLALTAFASHVRGRPFLDRITLVAEPDAARRAADVAAGRVALALDAGAERGPDAPFQRLALAIDAGRAPCDRPEVRAAVAGAATSADLRAFADGAAGAPIAIAPRREDIGPLRLAVASDVPPAASQRLAAVLEATGARLELVVLPPGRARRDPGPLRLVLAAPEVRDARVEARQEELLSGGHDQGLLSLARLPVRVARDPKLQGVVVTPDTRVELEDAWLAP